VNEDAAGIGSVPDWRGRLAGSGPLGVFALVVVLLGMILLTPVAGSILVLIWAWQARVPFAEIGFVRPPSWVRSVLYGVLLGVGLKLVMKVLVLPLLGIAAVNEQFHFVQGNPRAALGLAAYAFIAAFSEETFFRGYLFQRIGTWLGKDWFGATAAVVLSSALFGILHVQHGGGHCRRGSQSTVHGDGARWGLRVHTQRCLQHGVGDLDHSQHRCGHPGRGSRPDAYGHHAQRGLWLRDQRVGQHRVGDRDS
jgi:membrane protease YdiL (CAAX protease family)